MNEVPVSTPAITTSPGIAAEPSSGDGAFVLTRPDGSRVHFMSLVRDGASGGKFKGVKHGLDPQAQEEFLTDADGNLVIE